ncbi:CinA family protein [Marinobacter xestospongiae]|uniref:CinA family protein n=1 Tax=Marinobacter xestospongiae TaxID=994319 RepID=UPI002006B7C4|nr:nicotinamide-nucleotide amidohydrolase family protein [Marinobacter xestospongiae]MCK7566920.1 nicotinamide-nucleotide amidohydrolase family protein [Marinobacter xestospongiae]
MTATDQQLWLAGETLAGVLEHQGLTITTAESCTGGWVAKVLTDRPGSSVYLHSGLVTYSNDAKQRLLGVTSDSLAAHGAVSEPVVREMVAGALKVTGTDLAVATSGVAGPGGGSVQKPVGTVWFAWGTRDDIRTARCWFDGDREAVRRQSVLYVLQSVTEFLQG